MAPSLFSFGRVAPQATRLPGGPRKENISSLFNEIGIRRKKRKVTGAERVLPKENIPPGQVSPFPRDGLALSRRDRSHPSQGMGSPYPAGTGLTLPKGWARPKEFEKSLQQVVNLIKHLDGHISPAVFTRTLVNELTGTEIHHIGEA